MKAEISQLGLYRERRFSGVYQQQGRMLVDRDWNELCDILRDLGTAVGSQAIGTGVPRVGGLLSQPDQGKPVLALNKQGGLVAASGVIGEVQPREAGTDKPIYANQLDLPAQVRVVDANTTQPLQKDTPDKRLLYVDVWERTVTPFEIADLVDPALHGADTCVRTQRMAQIKAATAADLDNAAASAPAFLANRIQSKGNAELAATLTPAGDADPCDPLADQVTLARSVANMLFRVEVHSVEFDVNRNPTRLVLKWSRDNGARELRAGDAASGQRSYEYFSDATERLLGMPSDDWQAEEGLRGLLDPDEPAKISGVLPRIREWDGWCELTAGPNWGIGDGRHGGQKLGAAAAVSSGALSMPLDDLGLSFSLALTGKTFLAGDYWLVLVRTRAPEDQRVRVISATPLGVEHRYCILGTATVKDDDVSFAGLSAADLRRLQHPALTGLDAADVAYAPDPAALVLKGQDTVKKALDALGAAQSSIPLSAVEIEGATSVGDELETHPARLQQGIRMTFAAPLTARTFSCMVSLLLPEPISESDRAMWRTGAQPAFHTVELAGSTDIKDAATTVVWKPDPATMTALPGLFAELARQGLPLRVRAGLRVGSQYQDSSQKYPAAAEKWFWLDPQAPPVRIWTKIVDRMQSIAAAADGEAWCVSRGAGEVFRYVGGLQNIERIPGPADNMKLKQVSLGSRSAVWAIGENNVNIYRYLGAGQGWQQTNGSLTQISVAADGTVGGVNSDNQAFRLKSVGKAGNADWHASGDGMQAVVAGSRSEIWARNASNALQRLDQNQWEAVPGAPTAKHISVAADGTAWCVRDVDGAALRYLGPARGWEEVFAPKLLQVAVGSRSQVWGLADDTDGSVYRWDWAWQQPLRIVSAEFLNAAGDTFPYGRIEPPFGQKKTLFGPWVVAAIRLTFTSPLHQPAGDQYQLKSWDGRMAGMAATSIKSDGTRMVLTLGWGDQVPQGGLYTLNIGLDKPITDQNGQQLDLAGDDAVLFFAVTSMRGNG